MMISRTGFVVAAVVGASAALGGLSVSVLFQQTEQMPVPLSPPPQIVQPQIDEGRIADLVAKKLIEAEETKLAAEREKHHKADCAFWGSRMKGCS